VAGWSIFPADGVGNLISGAAATIVPVGVVPGLVFLTAVALISERFPEKETQPLIFIKVFWIKN
jgi:hypothetical protein